MYRSTFCVPVLKVCRSNYAVLHKKRLLMLQLLSLDIEKSARPPPRVRGRSEGRRPVLSLKQLSQKKCWVVFSNYVLIPFICMLYFWHSAIHEHYLYGKRAFPLDIYTEQIFQRWKDLEQVVCSPTFLLLIKLSLLASSTF